MNMTEANTIAWIFLAISFWDKSPVTRSEIFHSADAINHAVPLESEFQLAIRFLTQHELIEKNGKFFAITESGRAILEPVHDGSSNIFDVWKVLEARIAAYNAA